MSRGDDPYPEVENKDVLEIVKEGKLNKQPTDCPQSVYKVMVSCWNLTPNQRPSFEQIWKDIDSIEKTEFPDSQSRKNIASEKIQTSKSEIDPISNPEKEYPKNDEEKVHYFGQI